MGKSKEPESEDRPKKAKGSGVGITGWIMLGLLVPLGVMTFNCARSWTVTAAKEKKLNEEMGRLTSRNAVLAPFYDVLQNRRYQICNRTADVVTVNWLSTTYNESEQIKIFDSARCKDWKPVVLQPGENRMVTLSS